jgi:signal peptidase II
VPESTERSRRPFPTKILVIAGLVVLVDQVTKAWALGALAAGTRQPVLGNLLGLELIRNAGAALSIGTSMTWLLTLLAVAVVVVILRAASKATAPAWAVTLGLLLGGALGNLIDRLVRDPGPLRGHVVDFIAYGTWFIGNVADIAVVAAAVMMMVLVGFGVRLDGSRGA